MAVSLPDPDAKAAVVREMFDRIAPRYTRLNTILTFGLDRGWRRATIAAAGVRAGDLVVDVGCGTGDLAALAVAAGARVIAVDVAPAMLAHARGCGGMLLRADAAALPIRRATVHAVTCGFALRNVVAIPPVLAEAARVLRPGGRLALLEVAAPSGGALGWGHRLYFNHVVPRLGALLSDGRAYAYLPASMAYLPPADVLRRLIEDAGFVNVRRRRLGAGSAQLVSASRATTAVAGRAA